MTAYRQVLVNIPEYHAVHKDKCPQERSEIIAHADAAAHTWGGRDTEEIRLVGRAMSLMDDVLWTVYGGVGDPDDARALERAIVAVSGFMRAVTQLAREPQQLGAAGDLLDGLELLLARNGRGYNQADWPVLPEVYAR